jgi:hypothetical protein
VCAVQYPPWGPSLHCGVCVAEHSTQQRPEAATFRDLLRVASPMLSASSALGRLLGKGVSSLSPTCSGEGVSLFMLSMASPAPAENKEEE